MINDYTSFQYSHCATSRSHLSSSWALVITESVTIIPMFFFKLSFYDNIFCVLLCLIFDYALCPKYTDDTLCVFLYECVQMNLSVTFAVANRPTAFLPFGADRHIHQSATTTVGRQRTAAAETEKYIAFNRTLSCRFRIIDVKRRIYRPRGVNSST